MEKIGLEIFGRIEYINSFEIVSHRNVIIVQNLNAHNMVEDISNYIENRFRQEVKWYDKKAIKNKNCAQIFNVITIFCGALTPIFAALDYQIITIILASIVTISFGLLKFYKFEEHWHNYRTICETLKKEENYFTYRTQGYSTTQEPEKLFVERIESLISRENTTWSSIIKTTSKKDLSEKKE